MPAKKSAKPEKATSALHLIDASVYIFRAYFSMPDSIRDGEGRPINAVYGFADFLVQLLAALKQKAPRKSGEVFVGAFFDESLTSSFRNEVYPAYKANRELPPADLERQLQLCREICSLLGIVERAHARYEADDLIAFCLHKHRARVARGVIVSSDKDLAQLLQKNDQLWDYARDRTWGPKEVAAHFGVGPEYIADLLALAGDAVDNIPGLPGIGQKTAAALIQQFGGLAEILKKNDAIAASKLRGAQRLATTLRENQQLARTCYEITRIQNRPARGEIDPPQIPTLRELRWSGPDFKALDAFFEREAFGGRLRTRIERVLG